MFFAIAALLFFMLAFVGLVLGAFVPPFLYPKRRGLALVLNLVGFCLFVPMMTWVGQASAADLLLVAGAVAAFFIAVETLVFLLRGIACCILASIRSR